MKRIISYEAVTSVMKGWCRERSVKKGIRIEPVRANASKGIDKAADTAGMYAQP